jgi:hypothetical protein
VVVLSPSDQGTFGDVSTRPAGEHGPHALDCVEFWPEVRYANYGYDHVVHLYSRCDVSATCDVSTDVSPDKLRVDVPPGAEVEVLTRRGSPARRFTPRVECTLVR